MPQASQELRMPDAAWEKMAKACQDQQMQNTAEEKNMPEAFQDDAHVEKPPGQVRVRLPVQRVTLPGPKSRKRPRDKGAEKVTFENGTRPKTPMMLNMWESTRMAFNEKIKSVILHPAKNEPEFCKYCVQSWMTPESMQEADFFQQAVAMAKVWLKAKQDKVVQK